MFSVLLFGGIALYIVRQIPGYSFYTTTLSQSIFLLQDSKMIALFKYNFLLKGVLDFVFVLYVIQKLRIPLFSFFAFVMLLSPVLFASLAYFTEKRHKMRHYITTYASGLLWFIGALYLAWFVRDAYFFQITVMITILSLGMAFLAQIIRRTNILVQITCVAMMWLWVVLFVVKFL